MSNQIIEAKLSLSLRAIAVSYACKIDADLRGLALATTQEAHVRSDSWYLREGRFKKDEPTLFALQMICCSLPKTPLPGTFRMAAWSFRILSLLPTHAPEPRQFIPRPLTMGVAARKDKIAAVENCMLALMLEKILKTVSGYRVCEGIVCRVERIASSTWQKPGVFIPRTRTLNRTYDKTLPLDRRMSLSLSHTTQRAFDQISFKMMRSIHVGYSGLRCTKLD